MSEDRYVRHGHCTVAQLAAVLRTRLLPSDVLVSNDVGNLAVLRDDRYVGFVELSNRDLGAEPKAHFEKSSGLLT